MESIGVAHTIRLLRGRATPGLDRARPALDDAGRPPPRTCLPASRATATPPVLAHDARHPRGPPHRRVHARVRGARVSAMGRAGSREGSG